MSSIRCQTPTLSLLIALALASAFPPIACSTDQCTTNDDCDDGLFCNGDEICVHGSCVSGGLRDCDDHVACTIDRCDESSRQCVHEPTDRDGDGHFAQACDGDDCDDTNPDVYPGAEEICDTLDNDCDGVIEEDRDADGHLDPSLCPVDGDDCDDSDPSTYPGAPEPCDGVDNNCSGDTDDEADTDLDGFLDATCGGDDCDDENDTIFPDADETCDGLDDDCDGEIDEDFQCAAGFETECVTDCGFLGTGTCTSRCQPPTGDDCLGPDEICNGLDDDCDGEIDEDFQCAAGFETECVTSLGCAGYGTCTIDCAIPDPSRCTPADTPETCDGFDNDCDGEIDEDFPCSIGQEVPCTTTCGTTGSGPCTDQCQEPSPELCQPPPEICNDFIDNDCDGDEDCVDEDCIGDMACGY